RLGNAVVAAVLAARTGRHPGDLPPHKAIHAGALRALDLDEEHYAWTVRFVARHHGARRRFGRPRPAQKAS
nr:hypothetical protein [Chloroflexota bacterium]